MFDVTEALRDIKCPIDLTRGTGRTTRILTTALRHMVLSRGKYLFVSTSIPQRKDHFRMSADILKEADIFFTASIEQTMIILDETARINFVSLPELKQNNYRGRVYDRVFYDHTVAEELCNDWMNQRFPRIGV